ncbi:FMN reductase [NAD(P)H] [Brevinema andersonii]|uniref:FMN reductase [NAD(P)H] n=1 Tax=Brevinema andersonii TaxID=34097 RepID=A0A1I1EMI0_BREAD|nr:nitroreductase family protein [Brevinema andersonii]SFB86113.1 FMN reductase [NAD(P)H] [Brevinema andersonii]
MTNPVIETLLNHRTVLLFDPNKAVPQEILDDIIKATQQAPTAISGQQYSIIVIREKEKRQFIMEFAKGRGGFQQHITDSPVFLLFVIDFYKASLISKKENIPLKITDSIEGILAGSVDVGIALGTAVAAAKSFGLGTVCIGAIRNHDLTALISEFRLPKYTFPLVGLCIGYPTEEGKKIKIHPRLPLKTFAHQEYYNTEVFDDFDAVLNQYNRQIADHGKKLGTASSWTEFVAQIYGNNFPIHLIQNFCNQHFSI